MDKVLQTTNATHYDRYPEIFSVVSSIAKSFESFQNRSLNILSFGCSFGEEVKVFEEKYFQNHNIFGVDINESCINKCNTLGLKSKFYTTENFNELDLKFDIIFCMSVLCKMVDCINETPLLFSEFNETCEYLDSKIIHNGYFIDYNSNYSFLDSSIGYKYIPIEYASIVNSNKHTIKYRPNGIDKIETNICIYKKIKN